MDVLVCSVVVLNEPLYLKNYFLLIFPYGHHKTFHLSLLIKNSSPLFIISDPILSIDLSNASSAFLPILENLPFNQFHILFHELTFTRG